MARHQLLHDSYVSRDVYGVRRNVRRHDAHPVTVLEESQHIDRLELLQWAARQTGKCRQSMTPKRDHTDLLEVCMRRQDLAPQSGIGCLEK